jgi:transcriptional regulator with XRE-family HTH domain
MKTQVHIKQKQFEEFAVRRGLTYKELADKLGISRIYLSNLKNEKCPNFRPSGALRDRLMKELNCKFDDIFDIKQVEGNGAIVKKAKKKK